MSASKSKKKKPEGLTAEIINIMKPGSDKNIGLGDPILEDKLDKIDLIGRSRDVPSSDTLRLTVPDGETRATAEVLKTLQKQQPETGHHQSLNLSAPFGKAEYFEGKGLMRTI